MAIKQNQQLKRLALCASKDETKARITQVYKDKDSQSLYSADGHRLIKDKSSYSLVDTSFDAAAYLKTGLIYPINESYPTSMITEYFRYNFKSTHKALNELKLPSDIKHLSKFKKPFIGYFRANGDISIMSPSNDAVFALDLRLLDIFAGSTIKIWYTDATHAVTVELVDEPDVLAVIMPIRM